nr:MAG TPA: hypothetical protein [Caudoviricetes sp.]
MFVKFGMFYEIATRSPTFKSPALIHSHILHSL